MVQEKTIGSKKLLSSVVMISLCNFGAPGNPAPIFFSLGIGEAGCPNSVSRWMRTGGGSRGAMDETGA